jgi:DnaJ-like protein
MGGSITMTERKPPGLSWESWIDRQIREAEERGAFADLPGAGKPIPDLDKPFDELWWVKAKLQREGLSYLPPSVALRKEAHDALEAAARAKSEAEVRELIGEVNEKIRDANRKGIRGPSLMLMPFDPDAVVRDWRARRSQENSPPAET